ncbi:oxygenase MpaB family protein [Janibacter sp. DB-40]|uniref:oxygenase MpaB family protein n=1 Tax=Janibacter sp. DB-40 TaxID=3028808 RepID=UPI0024071E80|nr:oxygenase MpaB family protein [Janibacter sp. DB-40]
MAGRRMPWPREGGEMAIRRSFATTDAVRRRLLTTTGSAASGLRRRAGEAVRARVAGPEAEAAHARIWDTPGPRWFSPADPIWRVHGDASMFAAGITALLLQSLHPSAMAGVAGHSGYRGDPWGRLQRTSHYLATTTFGTVEHAEEAIAAVRSVHERVRGKDDEGHPYRANDPHLLRWVHIAEAWSFLAAHQRHGADPLTPEEADTYVAQSAVPAAALGATDLPMSVAALDAALDAARPELRATPAARDAADFLLREPPLPRAARPVYRLLALGAVDLLPGWARDELDLPAPTGAGTAGAMGTRLVRWSLAALDQESADIDTRAHPRADR